MGIVVNNGCCGTKTIYLFPLCLTNLGVFRRGCTSNCLTICRSSGGTMCVTYNLFSCVTFRKGLITLLFLQPSARQKPVSKRSAHFFSCCNHFAFYGEIWSHLKCHSFLREILLPDDYEIWDLEYFWMVSPKVSLFFEENFASR